MSETFDWDQVRRDRYSKTPPPPEWPSHLKPISLAGLGLFAIDLNTNDLFWDGHLIQTRRRLAWPERGLAIAATISAVVIAIVEVGRSAGWWL